MFLEAARRLGVEPTVAGLRRLFATLRDDGGRRKAIAALVRDAGAEVELK